MRKLTLFATSLLIALFTVPGVVWADPGDESPPQSAQSQNPQFNLQAEPKILELPEAWQRMWEQQRRRQLTARPQTRICPAQLGSDCAQARAIAEMPPCLKREGCQAYQNWTELLGPPAVRIVPSDEDAPDLHPIVVENLVPLFEPDPEQEPAPEPEEDE